ncbi:MULTISPECIES: DinB family protein [unclassified Endozoicomonas]|uniref:DinB family protein n=1 Tax=unclassified Endozoicomonas TaxID=2644528 RepID=UPI0021478AB6|nr:MULTISPECIES: DinB family protein [unclassified Endozoicomonas]
MRSDFEQVLLGNQEAVEQMIGFVSGMSANDYRFSDSGLFQSTIGQHLRHVLDLYEAVRSSSDELVDYDIRRRGLLLEHEKNAGLAELKDLLQWLQALKAEDLALEVVMKTEVLLSASSSVRLKSTLGRELIFASSHLIHHLAMMATIAKVAGNRIDPSVGMAPATSTFNRGQLVTS